MPWKRNKIELDGKISYRNRQDYTRLLCDTYSEVRSFTNCRCFRPNCPTYGRRSVDEFQSHRRDGISGIDFDSQGTYLAIGTKAGCLTILNFEQLYCTVYGPSFGLYDERSCYRHICIHQPVDVVRWTPINNYEVYCASYRRKTIRLYDINSALLQPIRTLERARNVKEKNGFSDLAFSSEGPSRLLASGIDGAIYAWDLRMGNHPSLKFIRKTNDGREIFTSLETDVAERMIFGATDLGDIIAWDIRGGTQSSSRVPYLERYNLHMMLIGRAPTWDDINPTWHQFMRTFTEVIHSIRRDPSCPNQLAFHVGGGGSGVYNIERKIITHLHCPIINFHEPCILPDYLRRQTWMPTNSVYSVANGNIGVHLVNFSPRKASENPVITTNERFIQTTQYPISCIVHPNTGTVIAGTPEDYTVMRFGLSSRPKSIHQTRHS